MTGSLKAELAAARDLHARLVPKKGRRARRRLGGQDVLRLARLVSNNPDVSAGLELEFLVHELLERGRHGDGSRVTRDDLLLAGVRSAASG